MTTTCETCTRTHTTYPCDTTYADGECPKYSLQISPISLNKSIQPISVIMLQLLQASDADKPSDKAD